MGDDEAARALDRLLELTVLLGRDMGGHLADRGLTESRAHVLVLLHDSGPVTQRALADEIGVSPRTVTGLVDGLVASGHVTREPHPGDRRATLVTPTPEGAEAARELAEGRVGLARAIFIDWTTPHIARLADDLEEVLDTVEALIEEETEEDEP